MGSLVRYAAGTGRSTTVGGSPAARTANGAQKVYTEGVAPFSGMYQCACRGPRFDVDPYGRLFLPNAITGKAVSTGGQE